MRRKKANKKAVTLRIIQLRDCEWDIVNDKAGVDAHCRWEQLKPNKGWTLDIFHGTDHLSTIPVGNVKIHGPHWSDVINSVVEWGRHV